MTCTPKTAKDFALRITLAIGLAGVAGTTFAQTAPAAPISQEPAVTAGQTRNNQHFKDILSRGTIRIGVQQSFKPFSFSDSTGKLQGLEIDLAQDVADTMGVKLELVPVTSSTRMQLLQQDKIDIIFAGLPHFV